MRSGHCRQKGRCNDTSVAEQVGVASAIGDVTVATLHRVKDDRAERVFRVTVRGRFAELTDQARRYLVGTQAEHHIFESAYTPEGTFTYDSRIDFFNFRFELREAGDHPSEAVVERAIAETRSFLRTLDFGARDLTADVVDMSAMWADVDLHQHP